MQWLVVAGRTFKKEGVAEQRVGAAIVVLLLVVEMAIVGRAEVVVQVTEQVVGQLVAEEAVDLGEDAEQQLLALFLIGKFRMMHQTLLLLSPTELLVFTFQKISRLRTN